MAQLVPYEGSLEGFVPEEELETQAQPQGTQPQLIPYEGDLEGFVPEEELQAQSETSGGWSDWLPSVPDLDFSSPSGFLDSIVGDKDTRELIMEKTAPGMTAAAVVNATKNVAQTGAMIGDKIYNTVTGAEGDDKANSAETLENALPEYQPTSTTGKFTIPIAEIASGFGTAGGLATLPGKIPAVGKALESLPNVVKSLGRYISPIAGSVAASDNKTKPNFSGDEAAAWEIWDGIGKDEKGNFSEELWDRKANLLIESLAFAKPLEIVMRGATGTLSWLWDETYGNLTNWKKLDPKLKQATKDTARVLSGFDPNASAKAQAEWHRKVAEAAERQAVAKYAIDVEGVDDAVVERTTSRALIEDGVSPADHARLAGVEAEVLAKGAPKTEAASSTASKELEQVANQTRKAFGGSEMADKSKDDIYTGVQKEIDDIDAEVTAKEFEGIRNSQNLDDVIKEDEFLGKSVSKSEAERDLSLVERHNATSDEIATSHYDAQRARADELKPRYKALEDAKIQIDRKSLDDGIAQLNQDEEVLPIAIAKMIERSDGSYGKFMRDIMPELKKAASDLAGKKEGRKAAKLREFINNQEDFQFESVMRRSNGNSKVAQEVLALRKDFRENVGQYRQGAAGKIEEQTQDNFLRPDDAIVDNRKTVKSTLDDPDSAEHSKRLFKSIPENKQHLKGDYVLGAWANKFADRIRDKGIDALDPTELAQFGRQYRPLLDGDSLKRYDKFISNVEKRKLTAKQFEDEIKLVRSNADKARKELESETAPFIDKQGKLKQEGDDVFEGYLNDKDGANQLDSLIKRADKTPDGRKGLKSSFVNLMKKKMFRSGTDPAGGKNVSETFVKALDDGDKLIKFGEKVFSDEPDVMAVYKGLMKEAGNATSLKGATKVSQTAINQADIQAGKGIDFMITQAFGMLSRWGARLRSATGKYISTQSSKDITLQARDAIQSNPQLFAKYMREEADKLEKGMTPNVKKRMYDFLVLQGTLTEEDKDSFLEDEVKKQTKKIFGVD